MQTYARKLGTCLLEMSDNENSSAAEDMHRWITELTSLTICVSLGNPKGLKAFHSASMDGSSATVNQLPDSFYEDLLVGSHFMSVVRSQHAPHNSNMLVISNCRNCGVITLSLRVCKVLQRLAKMSCLCACIGGSGLTYGQSLLPASRAKSSWRHRTWCCSTMCGHVIHHTSEHDRCATCLPHLTEVTANYRMPWSFQKRRYRTSCT